MHHPILLTRGTSMHTTKPSAVMWSYLRNKEVTMKCVTHWAKDQSAGVLTIVGLMMADGVSTKDIRDLRVNLAKEGITLVAA